MLLCWGNVVNKHGGFGLGLMDHFVAELCKAVGTLQFRG